MTDCKRVLSFWPRYINVGPCLSIVNHAVSSYQLHDFSTSFTLPLWFMRAGSGHSNMPEQVFSVIQLIGKGLKKIPKMVKCSETLVDTINNQLTVLNSSREVITFCDSKSGTTSLPLKMVATLAQKSFFINGYIIKDQ